MIMNIESATYIEATNTTVKAVIDGVTMFIPVDVVNTDYQAILEWVAEGNTIEEAE
jgi:hypothetical protein